MAYNIYKLIKSFPTRDQAIAELYSIGAIVSDGMPDFGVGPNGPSIASSYIIDGYTLVFVKLIEEE